MADALHHPVPRRELCFDDDRLWHLHTRLCQTPGRTWFRGGSARPHDDGVGLAQFLLAPCTGTWADRFGRRPFILLALAGLTITHLAFLSAQSVSLLIALRFVQGAVSVGLRPSVMGMIADLVPAQRRMPWVGVIMSGYAVGFVFGPAIGVSSSSAGALWLPLECLRC